MNEQSNTNPIDQGSDQYMGLTAQIVSAFLGNSTNRVQSDEVTSLIQSTYTALRGLGEPAPQPEAKQEPAVSIRASIKPDYLVCLEDGQKVKMLKRYLMTKFNLTPDQYRAKWGLPSDYPMVAPNYSARRKELAKSIGLGTKGRRAKAATAEGSEGTTAKKSGNGRRKKAETTTTTNEGADANA